MSVTLDSPGRAGVCESVWRNRGRMAALFLVLLWLLAGPPGAGAEEDPTLPFMVHLDPDELISLRWGFREKEADITFQLSVPTTGWVGFGLSPNGDMVGADIVIGGVGPGGNYFNDRHGIGKVLPLVDRQQSYTLLSLTEADNHTTMTFSRSIQTCDEDDFHITASPIKLIYAYGVDDNITYHESRRGTKEVNLLHYLQKSSFKGELYLNATMENVSVPSQHTYYHCRTMQFPWLSEKHHIYMIEPAIENPEIVHHMLLYGCPPRVMEASDEECYLESMEDCFHVIAAWAVGGGPFVLPENAGIPIGGNDSDKFYRLEIHYNNPTAASGWRDSSGLRLYYTADLREHDAGILMTGIIVNSRYQIPARADVFHSYGTCDTASFSQLVDHPIPDLHAFAVVLHTHLAGRRVRVGHFRNETQIGFLGLNDAYDFELQEADFFGNIKTIKPGDEMVVECTYSTTDRTKPTRMGLSTTEEMCLAFLFYYPAIDVTVCWSLPETIVGMTNPSPVNPENIKEYENKLKTAAQIELTSNLRGNDNFNRNSMVRDMMESPAVGCEEATTTFTTHTETMTTLATMDMGATETIAVTDNGTTTATPPCNMAPCGIHTSWSVTSAGSVLLFLLCMALF